MSLARERFEREQRALDEEMLIQNQSKRKAKPALVREEKDTLRSSASPTSEDQEKWKVNLYRAIEHRNMLERKLVDEMETRNQSEGQLRSILDQYLTRIKDQDQITSPSKAVDPTPEIEEPQQENCEDEEKSVQSSFSNSSSSSGSCTTQVFESHQSEQATRKSDSPKNVVQEKKTGENYRGAKPNQEKQHMVSFQGRLRFESGDHTPSRALSRSCESVDDPLRDVFQVQLKLADTINKLDQSVRYRDTLFRTAETNHQDFLNQSLSDESNPIDEALDFSDNDEEDIVPPLQTSNLMKKNKRLSQKEHQKMEIKELFHSPTSTSKARLDFQQFRQSLKKTQQLPEQLPDVQTTTPVQHTSLVESIFTSSFQSHEDMEEVGQELKYWKVDKIQQTFRELNLKIQQKSIHFLLHHRAHTPVTLDQSMYRQEDAKMQEIQQLRAQLGELQELLESSGKWPRTEDPDFIRKTPIKDSPDAHFSSTIRSDSKHGDSRISNRYPRVSI